MIINLEDNAKPLKVLAARGVPKRFEQGCTSPNIQHYGLVQPGFLRAKTRRSSTAYH